jgi:hypothetical protein
MFSMPTVGAEWAWCQARMGQKLDASALGILKHLHHY